MNRTPKHAAGPWRDASETPLYNDLYLTCWRDEPDGGERYYTNARYTDKGWYRPLKALEGMYLVAWADIYKPPQ